jgi:hypothetical protein
MLGSRDIPTKEKASVCGDQNAEVDEWRYKKQKQKQKD